MAVLGGWEDCGCVGGTGCVGGGLWLCCGGREGGGGLWLCVGHYGMTVAVCWSLWDDCGCVLVMMG